MIIYPLVGVGDLKLGMTRDLVIDLLGKPESLEVEAWPDQTITEYLEYKTIGLSLAFCSRDGDRLGTISVDSYDVRLEGEKVVGRPINEFIKVFPQFKLADDFGELGSDYVSQAEELSVWVTSSVIDRVSIMPEWRDDDTLIWPCRLD